jgi:hypothetical protein
MGQLLKVFAKFLLVLSLILNYLLLSNDSRFENV